MSNSERAEEQLKSEEPKFAIDTNVLIAYLNPRQPFHLEASTAIAAIKATNAHLVIPHVVLGEFIAHRKLLKKGSVSVSKALGMFDNFIKVSPNILIGGPSISLPKILQWYKDHSRHIKVTTDMGFVDFLILSQVSELKNGRIITCDKPMYQCGKTVFKERIYYLPSQAGGKNDFGRLINEVQLYQRRKPD